MERTIDERLTDASWWSALAPVCTTTYETALSSTWYRQVLKLKQICDPASSSIRSVPGLAS